MSHQSKTYNHASEIGNEEMRKTKIHHGLGYWIEKHAWVHDWNKMFQQRNIGVT